MLSRRTQIIAFRKQGLSRRQMAKRLGISLDLVGSYLHQLLTKGIVKPSTRRPPQTASKKVDVRAARRLRLNGKSYKTIGIRFGVAGSTISRLLGSTIRVTPVQRRLILLHGKGMTYEAIAAKVGKPTGTVAVVLARLVKKGLLPKRSRFGSSETILLRRPLDVQ